MLHVLFTDDRKQLQMAQTTGGSGWVLKETKIMFRRQQGGEDLMIWTGIIDNTIVGRSCGKPSRMQQLLFHLHK